MATHPIDVDHDFEAAVARASQLASTSNELRRPIGGGYVSPLRPEEREAVRTVLRDGTYARAAAAVGASDPDLADQ